MESSESINTQTPVVPLKRDHVVILVHGIRDYALWQNDIRAELEDAGFKVELSNYERFNLLAFLEPSTIFRRQAISEVWEDIKTIRQNHRDADISVIAHSFGTYVIARLILQNFDAVFHRVIFCGSVIRYRYPFKRLQNQFTKPILNEVGTRDIWPAIAESVTVGYGSAGTYGFRKPLIRDRWHNRAKHGYFLNRKFCRKFWIPFLRDGTVVESSEKPERPSSILVLLSIFKVKYLAMLLAALMAVWIWQQKWPFWPQKPYPIAAYLGTWQNQEQTLGITRVTVREEGPDVLVKIWGSCRPTDCEIPELKGHVYGASVQARAVDEVRAVEAELVESYANRRFILRLLNENTLSVEARTRFIDNSGRSDFQFTDTLEKTSN